MLLLRKYNNLLIFMFVLVIALAGCNSISVFSQYAYQQAVDLKAASLSLISHSDQTYQNYQKDVEDLNQKIDKAYEYAKGRKDNELSIKQWEILKDPDGNMLGGFLKKWKSQDKISSTYLSEKIKQISDAFDEIINLENRKPKQ